MANIVIFTIISDDMIHYGIEICILLLLPYGFCMKVYKLIIFQGYVKCLKLKNVSKSHTIECQMFCSLYTIELPCIKEQGRNLTAAIIFV